MVALTDRTASVPAVVLQYRLLHVICSRRKDSGQTGLAFQELAVCSTMTYHAAEFPCLPESK